MTDDISIIDSLNDAQRLAVSTGSQAVLVLAGAGSGKTRVLVHRIAWQIHIEGLSMHSILAVTFTNKAAKEMRGRIESLLNTSAQSMWIGTFHGLAHRLLRRHAEHAKLAETFQVIDSDDQLRLVKRILKSMNLDDSKWPPKQVQWFINGQKDEGIRAKDMLESNDLYQRQMLAAYRAYEQLCERSSLVDFAELLLRAHELLRDNNDLLSFYRERFQQVHVDEFQDTNTIQYAWLRLLTEGNDNLFVVGDDDQSIYGWRGAKIENLHQFQRDYPNHKIIKLEQNYRSTGYILKAANALIAKNHTRMGKELWTDTGNGELISLYAAFNEQDEAYFVVEKIRQWIKEGNAREDVAILYRSNAQSRQFEEKLMATATPYRVYGGLRFFDRMEIKNALAYLQVMSNCHNDASFERIFNTPPRGIGARTIDHVRSIAKQRDLSLWQASIELINQNQLSTRASNALKGFLELIKQLSGEADGKALFEKVKLIVEKSGLIDAYQKEKGDKGEVRIDNLKELVNAARLFDFDENNEENLSELDVFLAHATLESGEMQGDHYEDCIQLMSFHSAKGLEFKLVFLVGMEEGLFPSQQSRGDEGKIEEERRLCYVGITRAMQQLYITHAESRRLYGKETYPRVSRFLREIPSEFLQEVRIRTRISRSVIQAKPRSIKQTRKYRIGQRVSHPKFGKGVVLQMEGEGLSEKIQINFSAVGLKWLVLSYVKLDDLS